MPNTVDSPGDRTVSGLSPASTPEEIRAAAARIADSGASARTAGRDPINQPMIHNWVEAMGDDNPIYVDEQAAREAGHLGIVAPPAMAQVWTMRGLHGVRPADDPFRRATELFDDAGYTSVVATNSDSVYHRYTRPGEEVTASLELTDVTGPKQTALGEGWFFTTKYSWHVGDELVAEMDFRILKFRPASAPPRGQSAAGRDGAGSPAGGSSVGGAGGSSAGRTGGGPSVGDRVPPTEEAVYRDLEPNKLMRPQVSQDTQFFWDGVAAHELRIQQLPDGTLHHPPIPATWTERDADGVYPGTEFQVAAGTGTVYSYVVHHAPKVPGRSLPFVVALVELDEGVRMLGELRGVDREKLRVGLPVEVTFLDFPADGDRAAWTLYAWRPTQADDQQKEDAR